MRCMQAQRSDVSDAIDEPTNCESRGQAREIELNPSGIVKGSTLPATENNESGGRHDALTDVNQER
jgi:hypothetical protein